MAVAPLRLGLVLLIPEPNRSASSPARMTCFFFPVSRRRLSRSLGDSYPITITVLSEEASSISFAQSV